MRQWRVDPSRPATFDAGNALSKPMEARAMQEVASGNAVPVMTPYGMTILPNPYRDPSMSAGYGGNVLRGGTPGYADAGGNYQPSIDEGDPRRGVMGTGASTSAPSGARASGDPSWDAIRAGIFAGESGGDYNALYGFSNRPGGDFANVRVTDMTVDEALAFSRGQYGDWSRANLGYRATPMGAYQVVGNTLQAAKQGLGLTGQERLTPEMQDRIGRWIYETQGTGAWEGYRGPGDFSQYQ